MNPFDVLLINPILNLLLAIYKVLSSAGLPGALGFSIITLTTAIRLVLWPLTSSQLKSTQKMAALKPHLDRIKAEHGHDKLKHQEEVNKLYKEHGVNPLAGCLPLLLQLPVFFALYNVLRRIVDFQNANFINSINARLYSSQLHLDKIPDTSFLGLNIASKPNQWHEIGLVILLVPILTGVFQLIQSLMITPQPTAVEPVAKKNQSEKKKEEKKEDLQDSMAQVQGQMVFLMPAMIGFFAYGFPIGLSLYWNTFTIIGIIQQYLISGPGSLNKYLPKGLRK
ncbi:MAG TPA: YidC/Oxa1 family membrane protein insertase [Candidatus Saccharimonadales bacterium]|nr:YidC/Oxa1 family membrane protein insertase [Candidatus Saccharimonadales bacterium]